MSYDERFAAILTALRAQPHIEVTPTIGRLTDALVLAGDVYHLYAVVGRQALEKRMLDGVLDHLEAAPLREGIDGSKADEVKTKMREGLAASVSEKQGLLGQRVLNHGLVSLCTAFDMFLDHCTDTALRVRPALMYGDKTSPKTVSLKSVVEAGSLESIIAETRREYVYRLAYGGIRKRLNWFAKVGVDVNSLFAFAHASEEARKRLGTWSLDRLDELYQRRHAIVHVDALRVASIEELSDATDVLTQLTFGLAIALHRGLGVLTDWAIPVLAQEAASEPPKESG